MKKKFVFFAAIACLGMMSLTSCGDDECTCTEHKTGESVTEKLEGYSSCKELQKALNNVSDGYLDWTCK